MKLSTFIERDQVSFSYPMNARGPAANLAPAADSETMPWLVSGVCRLAAGAPTGD